VETPTTILRHCIILLLVLYRFGGTEFPPIIMFKIFVQSGGQGVKYYCGKKVIKPSSKVNQKSYSEHFILIINLKDRT